MIVATCRALKYHGGVAMKDLGAREPRTRSGAASPTSMRTSRSSGSSSCPPSSGSTAIRPTPRREYQLVAEHCAKLGVPHACGRHLRPGRGRRRGTWPAASASSSPATRSDFAPLYALDQPVKAKLDTIARAHLRRRRRRCIPAAWTGRSPSSRPLGYGGLPVCVAKTQRSLSDDPIAASAGPRASRSRSTTSTSRRGRASSVAITGDITTMPGFPRKPNAEGVDVTPDGRITGLF